MRTNTQAKLIVIGKRADSVISYCYVILSVTELTLAWLRIMSVAWWPRGEQWCHS